MVEIYGKIVLSSKTESFNQNHNFETDSSPPSLTVILARFCSKCGGE